jgi:predicted MFS family arabinose efflux permease
MTGSPFKLGIVSFCAGVSVLVFSLWAGVYADRVPKRRLLLATQTAMMALAFMLAADVFAGTVQWWHVAIFAFFLGTANAFDAPTRQAFVVEMVGRKELPNAIALNSAMFNVARIAGPALAGITLAAVGAKWCFVLNGASFLAVIAGLLMMDVKPYVGAASTDSPLRQMREGLGYIRHQPVVRPLIGLVAVSNMFASGYMALLPAFAQDVLHVGTVGYGFMSTAVGVGALAGALARRLPWQGADAHRRQSALPGDGDRRLSVQILSPDHLSSRADGPGVHDPERHGQYPRANHRARQTARSRNERLHDGVHGFLPDWGAHRRSGGGEIRRSGRGGVRRVHSARLWPLPVMAVPATPLAAIIIKDCRSQ